MPLILRPLTSWDPIWSLLIISVLLGIAMLWVFARISNQKEIRRTRDRLKASLMELRLFGDEPSLVFRAQKDLLIGNGRLMALTLRPALILTLPLLLLFSFLEPFYGRSPLRLGEPAIVTLHFKQPMDLRMPPPKIEPPSGVLVETPAVRAIEENEVSWRIRPERSIDSILRVVLPNEAIEKSIAAGTGRGYASDRRASSWLDWIWNPGEPPIASEAVEWIEIRYPYAEVQWLGVEFHWIVWLLIVSMIAALLLKRRMGVYF
jgi:uncharacterized membrane protein (DUF106 family)